MKKITLLIIPFLASMMFSQSLPIDFEDALDANMIGADGAVFNVITDPDTPSEKVGEVTVGAQLYSNIQIDLAENLDLSDDGNNTITFRFKPQNGTGSNSHLLKFELGPAGANTELAFTTDGTTNWQNISVNFGPGLTNYSRLVVFPDFNNTMTDTYLIDDIAGGTNIAPPPAAQAILPIYFSNTFELFNGQGAVTSLTTDPLDVNNDVMQVTSGGALYDNAQLELAKNVDLSDPGNNTITFRIMPINGTGSNSHLLKFESAKSGDATIEVAFTTTGTAWQNISLDYDNDPGSNPGNYARIVLFTDFNNTMQDTYLIDDIAGGTNVEPAVPPSSPAPNPTTPDANAFRLYGDTGVYSANMTYDYTFGSLAGSDPDLDPGAGVNKALWFDFAGPGWGAGQNTATDVSALDDYVSFQYYTTDAKWFYFDLISIGGGDQEAFYHIGDGTNPSSVEVRNEAIVQGAWTQVVIPRQFFIDNYPAFDPTTWAKYKFDSSVAEGTVYIDNILFSSVAPTLGINDKLKSAFKIFPNPAKSQWTIKTQNVEIDAVQLFDILGKEVLFMNPNTTEVSINASKLSKGMYFAIITTSVGNESFKLIKE